MCEFCGSILVRTDLDLKKVGTVADFALEDASPIQINTEGVHDQKAFVVVGRIIYEWDQGGWNEWYLMFNDGSFGWLSDAQLEWAVTKQYAAQGIPNSPDQIHPGKTFTFGSTDFEVTVVTHAHYKGVEGQLPFEYWDKQRVTFIDLRTHTREFATLDFSDPQPQLYVGRFVEFEDLRLTNLRQFEGWT
ncbi:MAG TPA: DUF4178 domain-containing protein [Bryobacteraceae bacterium]